MGKSVLAVASYTTWRDQGYCEREKLGCCRENQELKGLREMENER
jgi:hypothetical protein